MAVKLKKTYQVLYADPPWRYSFVKVKRWGIEEHYPTMTLEEICSMRVPAASSAVLYLWATAPKLADALKVMAAWGFEYKTCAVWDKEWTGMGYWFRNQHELLLVGTRGKFSPPHTDFRAASLYREKKGRHSKKPDYFRTLIASAFPNMRKLELFARQRAKGWASTGFDADGKDARCLNGNGKTPLASIANPESRSFPSRSKPRR